jgi:hypothetical protein
MRCRSLIGGLSFGVDQRHLFEFRKGRWLAKPPFWYTNSSTVPFSNIRQSQGAGFAVVAAVCIRTLVVQLSVKAL